VVAAAREHEAFLTAETLTTQVSYGALVDGFPGAVGDGVKVTVSVARA
jgi:isoleucyl-tRNA synthetase